LNFLIFLHSRMTFHLGCFCLKFLVEIIKMSVRDKFISQNFSAPFSNMVWLLLLFRSINIFFRVRNVEEVVFFMMFLIERAHCGWCWWDHIVNEEEQCIFWAQINSFANEEVELAYRQVGWNQILFLVQVTDACFWGLLYNHRHTIWIFPSDFVTFSPSLLKWALLFVLELHFRWNFLFSF